MSSLASVVNALGEKLGIAGLALDTQGCCRLVFDGKHMLELRASNAQRRLIMSLLCAGFSDAGSAGMAQALLKANLWGAGTGGGWFAIDEKGRACLQQEVMLGEDSAAHMLARMEGMLNGVELWEQRFAAGVSYAASAESNAMARMTQRV